MQSLFNHNIFTPVVKCSDRDSALSPKHANCMTGFCNEDYVCQGKNDHRHVTPVTILKTQLNLKASFSPIMYEFGSTHTHTHTHTHTNVCQFWSMHEFQA